MKRQRGVTLLELLLALSLGALLLSAVLPMLNLSISAASNPAAIAQADLERQAAFAINRINMVVRAKAPATLATVAGITGPLASLNPVAQDPATSGTWFAPSTFLLSGTAAPYTLVEQRTGDSVLHVLAESVNSFKITALPVTDGRQLVQVDLVLKTSNAMASVTSVMRMGWMQ